MSAAALSELIAELGAAYQIDPVVVLELGERHRITVPLIPDQPVIHRREQRSVGDCGNAIVHQSPNAISG